MKKILNKGTSQDKGIAIMFTLIMLSIFFLIAFGFVSMATTAGAASKAREPGQNTSLNASETILNEALACMEERLYDGGKEYPDPSLFMSLNFRNSAVNTDLQAWGTSSSDRTDLEDALLIQLEPFSADGEMLIHTSDSNWSNFGWLNGGSGQYSWMVLESNGLDPNYLGSDNSARNVSGTRDGIYTRELDMRLIDTTNGETLYQDWSGFPWESKKQMIGALASNYETAVSIFQTNMSPVELTDFTSKYDLTTLQSDTSTDPSIVLNNIQWLNNGSSDFLKNQIAANIKDYIDEDTNCTYNAALNVYGVERAPQINEISISVKNLTDDPPTSGPVTTSQTKLELRCQAELVNIFNATSWGTVDGSGSYLEVEVNVVAYRDAASAINSTVTLRVNSFDLALGATPYTYKKSPELTDGSVETTEILGADLNDTSDVTVSVEVTKITLKGNSTTTWDVATPSTSGGLISVDEDIETQKEAYCAFEAECPRVNHTGWEDKGWTGAGISPTDILFSQESVNDNYDPTSWNGDFENALPTTQPWGFSTSYMPDGGGIQSISELGLISRGEKGKTLNLVDYNIKVPDALGNYKPTAASGFNLSNANGSTPSSSTFDGGDRAILDYVRVTSGDQYKQYSPLNPNTTNSDVLDFLFSGITTAKGDTITVSEITKVVDRFPGVAGLTGENIFKVEDFHNLNSDGYHNRNPKSFGYPFSRYSSSFIGGNTDDLPDAHREALLIKSMRLVSPKYSYYTILTADKDTSVSPAAVSSYYTFVRRENESGTYKIIYQTQAP